MNLRELTDALKLLVVQGFGVDLVGENPDVVLERGLGDEAQVFPRQHSAGRVLRRIDDDKLRACVHQRGQFFGIETEVALLTQTSRHGGPAHVFYHRLVYGEPGIGIDDLVSLFHQGHDGEGHDRLAARSYHHLLGV